LWLVATISSIQSLVKLVDIAVWSRRTNGKLAVGCEEGPVRFEAFYWGLRAYTD
jgi:hypothetical protein